MLTADSRLRDFPMLADMTYLNTAAEGLPPRPVIEALTQYATDKQLGMDGRTLHEAQWHRARAEVGAALGLSADEIGICSCSSEAFNLAALAMQFRPQDEVVINDLDFPAGATPWLQTACPATVRLWRSRQGALRCEDLKPLLNRNTRLVSTSLVSFYNGYRLPLKEVVEVVRRNSSALIAVDATQALGRLTLDLSEADLIISSTHKWLMASHGGGLVGVPESRSREWTVPAGGWFNLQNPFDADRFDQVRTKPGAASFCTGMPNYPAIYAIAAAASYLNAIRVAAIETQTDPLVRECYQGLQKLPVELLTPGEPEAQSGLIAFRHPRAEEIHRHLRARNIHLMYHAGRLRVALHGYNTWDDLDRLLAGMHEALAHA